MANNPLYPGYSPRKKDNMSKNPLYPGYYTGKKMPKRQTPSKYTKPIEYSFDEVAKQIDEVAKDVVNIPLGPKWVADRVADDWKQQYKVSVTPTSEIDVTELDDFATDDLAGATTELSLNAKDWGLLETGGWLTGEKEGVKKAKEQAVKTLKKWLKEATGIDANNILESNFSDIQNATIEKLWTEAFGYGEEKAKFSEKLAAKAIADRTTAGFKNVREGLQKGENPLSVKGVEATEIKEDGRVVHHKDLYANTVKSAAEFEKNRDNRKSRDSTHREFLSNALKATNIEILDHYRKGESEALNKHSTAIEFFDTRVKTLETIEGVQKKMSDTSKELAKGLIKKDPNIRTTALSDKLLEELNKSEEKIKNYNQKARDLINKGVPQKEVEKFLAETNKYQEHIEYLKENITKAQKGEMGLRQAIKTLSGPTPDKNFNNRTTVRDSLGGNLRRSLEKSTYSKEDFEIGSVLNDKDLESEGIDLKAKRLVPATYRLRQDRIHYATKEILDTFDKGGIGAVAEAYAWRAVKNRMPAVLEHVTSGGIVGERLKKSNYFGLKIDERGTAWLDQNPPIKKVERFERKYGYNVDVKLDSRIVGLVGAKKINVSGKEADEYFKVLKNDKFKQFKFENKDDRILFSQLLNNDRSDETIGKLAQKIFGKNLGDLQEKDKEEIKNFLEQLEKSGKWIEGKGIKLIPKQIVKDGEELKPVIVDENNLAFLLFKNVFDKNNSLNDGYKLTDRKYIGRLEKLNNKLQSLQKWWNKRFIAKFLRTVQNWSKMIAEKVVALASKLIAKVIGGFVASTGVLAAIAPVIKAVAEKVIQKTLDYGAALVKAIFKMDFKDFDKMLQADFKKIAQSCLVLLSCHIILFLPVFLLVGLIVSALSPIDISRINDEGYGYIASGGGEPDERVFGCNLCMGTGECANYMGPGGGRSYDPGIGGFYYNQCDPQWTEYPINHTSTTMCEAGCYVTSIAMVYNYFGFGPPYTPIDISDRNDGVGDRFTSPKSDLIKNPEVLGTQMESLNGDSDDEMRNFFSNHPGGVIILELTNVPSGDHRIPQHFVVLSGWEDDKGDFILYDPYRGPDLCLNAEYPREDAIGREDADGYYIEGNGGECTIESDCDDTHAHDCGWGDSPSNELCNTDANVDNPIVKTALEIVCDLKPGFGCLFNKPDFCNMSKEYSYNGTHRIWDQQLYDELDGAWDEDLHNYENSLFWCTWLVKKSYVKEYGGEMNNLSLAARRMCDQIEGEELGLTKIDNNINNVAVGDIVCFEKEHVGIVFSVNGKDYIQTVESNSSGERPNATIFTYSADIKTGKVANIRFFGRKK